MNKRQKNSTVRTGIEIQDAAEKNLPLTQKELAAVLRCCPETVQSYTRQGMPCLYLGAVKGGKGSRPVYKYADCMAWLEKRNAPAE